MMLDTLHSEWSMSMPLGRKCIVVAYVFAIRINRATLSSQSITFYCVKGGKPRCFEFNGRDSGRGSELAMMTESYFVVGENV